MARNPAASHASYTALPGEGEEVPLLPHALYVALDAAGPSMEVAGETTTAFSFDADGRIDWYARVPPGCLAEPVAGAAGMATIAEAAPGCAPAKAPREALRPALFGSCWAARGPRVTAG